MSGFLVFDNKKVKESARFIFSCKFPNSGFITSFAVIDVPFMVPVVQTIGFIW